MASMDCYFFCADENPHDVTSNTQCCIQCTTLHTGILVKKTLSSIPQTFASSPVSQPISSLYQDPYLSKIERPPIPFLA